MRTVVYLIATRHGTVRMTKRPPDIYRDEVAVKVRITIPDKCFLTPMTDVDLDVPETAVIQPEAQVEAVEP